MLIQTVNQKSEQGHSEPFLCIAENGEEYFVKGKLSGRTSQINEWLCACMAKAIGLPIAPFAQLEICEDLYDELPEHLIEIGKGFCFGSLAQKNYALLEACDVHKVPIDLQRKIAAFDWLIKNEDRTLGNTNLLYRDGNNPLIVIDHNLAFDKSFNKACFLQNHIFAHAFSEILDDFCLQIEMEDYLKPALSAYPTACDNLPASWQWVNDENDVPTNYDFSFAQSTLNQLTEKSFWSRR